MEHCPKCKSNRIHRSRSRNWWERLRRDFSRNRPYRCEACGWRGWGPETDPQYSRSSAQVPDTPPPDFDALDEAVARERSKPDED